MLLSLGPALLIGGTVVEAQVTPPPRPATPAAQQQRPVVPTPLPATAFAALQYRNIGPNRGGRSLAAAGSQQRPREYYFGATGGGLWKTIDGGLNWRPVTDGQLRSSSVGAVAVAASGPDTVYIGMGETQLRGNIQQGDGIYRSVDGGRTWTHQGLAETQAIARIRTHPKNGAVAYAAAFGRPYETHRDRGVYRTVDAGRTWDKVLYRGDSVGAVDLAIDQKNPRVLYAAMWQAYRRPWKLSSGGAGSGLFKSIDGGDSWVDITRNPGMPRGIIGKIGVAVSPVDGNRVYAIVENDSGGVFVSDDAGATWRRANEERKLRQRAFYFSRIVADPLLKDRVYVLNVDFWRSDDGGRTFPTAIQGTHADFHDLWIAPDNSSRFISANDGGGAVTEDAARTFTAQRVPTAQPYHVITTKDVPYHVCGAQQDNSTFCLPSTPRETNTFNGGQGAFGDWLYDVGGGESGYIATHPTNPNIFFAGSQEGLLTRHDRSTGITRDVQPWPRFFSGEAAGTLPERWQWTFPIVFAPLEPNTVYAASQHLWRSTDDGQSWSKISPDLTVHADSTLGDSGGPITRDQNGPEFYGTIFTIAPSRRETNVIWTGSDDGLVHITRDGGTTWTNVTPKDLPKHSRVSLIDASAHEPGKAIVAAKRYQLGDRSAHVWKTTDYGVTWTNISDGFRSDAYVHAVREDPWKKGLLFAGTEHGVYVSFEDGTRWQPLSLNMPDVQVPDLQVEAHDLVVATHGRSMWILDDIDVLRQMSADAIKPNLALFTMRNATRRLTDAVVDYHLSRLADSVVIEVLDASGAIVRRFSSIPGDTVVPGRAATMGESLGPPSAGGNPTRRGGLNRFVWDLRYPGAFTFPGMILRSARPEEGPLAPPGEYQARVTANGETKAQKFRIVKHPRLTEFSDADLKAQFDLAVQIRDRVSAANRAVVQVRAVRAQVEARATQAADSRITTDAQRIAAALTAVEEALYQVRNRSPRDALNYPVKLNNKLAALQRSLETGDMRPTSGAQQVFTELAAELDVELRKLDALLQVDVPALNGRLEARKVPVVSVPPRAPVA
ncbi:MAG: glycosyl hydrolase [Cytophagaceae bacterium]|nr:glycosyl hydrolase [Gemmatimonadaceae bacterium]